MRPSRLPEIIQFLKDNGPVEVAEIATHCKLSRQALHRHLKNLEFNGTVQKVGISPKVKYRLIEEVPLSLDSIKDVLVKTYEKERGVALITLFGSFARGEETTNSDIDLLIWVKTNSKLTRHQIWQQWDEQNKNLDWRDRASLVVKTWSDEIQIHTLLLDMPEEHLLLLDRDGHFETLVSAIKNWRQKHGSFKINSFGGKHAWQYTDKDVQLSEIDFTLRIKNVA